MMEPSLNNWTSIFLIAAVQGIFLSLLIFLKKSKANNLLAFLILSFSICLICYVGYWTGYSKVIPWRFNAFLGLTYTFGPLMYFYIKSSKREVYFNFWHFIPFILFIIHFQNWNNYPAEWAPYIRTYLPVIQCSHLIIYSWLIIDFVLKNKGYSNGELKLYGWRKKLTFAFFGYSLTFLLYFILVWTDLLLLKYDYMISFASSFFIYFIGYYGFFRHDFFSMYENGRYEKSGLQSSTLQAIMITIKNEMESQKTYLNSSLRLPELAEKLNLSQHYISQAINDFEGKNFADFINEYRIAEAKQLLKDPEKKLIHVAYDSGFNNKNSFNNAFKRFTGVSPSEYKEKNMLTV
jgi:AraC-like DNA-binding protein